MPGRVDMRLGSRGARGFPAKRAPISLRWPAAIKRVPLARDPVWSLFRRTTPVSGRLARRFFSSGDRSIGADLLMLEWGGVLRRRVGGRTPLAIMFFLCSFCPKIGRASWRERVWQYV